MSNQDLIVRLEGQDWLEPAENTLQRIVKGAFRAAGRAGQTIEDFLHGKWLGHPLHSALTDIPIGAWTAAAVFDGIQTASKRDEFGAAADAAIAVGLVGAAGSAVTGLTDWQHVDAGTRRIGLIHGLMNLSGVALFTASLVARHQDHRDAGKIFSGLGLTVIAASSWLGGHLVYERQVGVDHTGGQSFPSEFFPIMRDAELKEGQMHRAEVNGAAILLIRYKNALHAIAETCSHLGGPLSEGRLVDGSVQCPWHGSRFDIQDGHVVSGPAVHPQPCLDARVRAGQIEVRLRSGKPGEKESEEKAA